ncbi:hypothetical protein CPLU01_07019 [Colletotrichum plurivorum]|uniref:Uncharacterized protein n=1 Tax=Colletotrichum plurivorum TaxID=2175906 RepID=A0A8H6KHQ5_9PEZI|nr:hypothetical protein CPLU01_07019 [Colletotrichum plurivorum]
MEPWQEAEARHLECLVAYRPYVEMQESCAEGQIQQRAGEIRDRLKIPSGKTLDDKTADDNTANANAADDKTAEDKTEDDERADYKTPDNKSADDMDTDGMDMYELYIDDSTLDDRFSDGKIADDKTANDKATGDMDLYAMDIDDKTADDENSDGMDTDNMDIDDKTAGDKATGNCSGNMSQQPSKEGDLEMPLPPLDDLYAVSQHYDARDFPSDDANAANGGLPSLPFATEMHRRAATPRSQHSHSSSPHRTSYSPSGRPTHNPMTAALSSGRVKACLYTDSNQRASIVAVRTPQKLRKTIDPTATCPPTPLHDVFSPSPGSTPSTGRTINDNQTPYRYESGAIMSSSPIREKPIEDPFCTRPRSRRGPPPTEPPREKDHNRGELYDVIYQQMRHARSLFSFGHPGPFQIGRFFCRINPYNGHPVPIALLQFDADRKVIAVHPQTKQDLSEIQPKGDGQANPRMPKNLQQANIGPFGANSNDIFMGAEEPWSEVMDAHDFEEDPPVSFDLGPAQAWIEEANSILGLRNNSNENLSELDASHHMGF